MICPLKMIKAAYFIMNIFIVVEVRSVVAGKHYSLHGVHDCSPWQGCPSLTSPFGSLLLYVQQTWSDHLG